MPVDKQAWTGVGQERQQAAGTPLSAKMNAQAWSSDGCGSGRGNGYLDKLRHNPGL